MVAAKLLSHPPKQNSRRRIQASNSSLLYLIWALPRASTTSLTAWRPLLTGSVSVIDCHIAAWHCLTRFNTDILVSNAGINDEFGKNIGDTDINKWWDIMVSLILSLLRNTINTFWYRPSMFADLTFLLVHSSTSTLRNILPHLLLFLPASMKNSPACPDTGWVRRSPPKWSRSYLLVCELLVQHYPYFDINLQSTPTSAHSPSIQDWYLPIWWLNLSSRWHKTLVSILFTFILDLSSLWILYSRSRRWPCSVSFSSSCGFPLRPLRFRSLGCGTNTKPQGRDYY